MKIEIKSLKITFTWWQLALIIATIILAFRTPELIANIVQQYFGST